MLQVQEELLSTKVSTIMSAAAVSITTASTPEDVTRKFNQLILVLHDKLGLEDLAEQLVRKCCE